MQSASDDVNETRVVWTCCKNNDGQHGPRSVWERRNGLFVPVKDFNWEAWDHPPNRSGRAHGRIDDLLELIPIEEPIKREDLYAKAAGKINRDDVRDFIGELLREARIFIHRIPNPLTRRSFVGYAQRPQQNTDPKIGTDLETEDDIDIEDDPR
jgi:hypothetical protein